MTKTISSSSLNSHVFWDTLFVINDRIAGGGRVRGDGTLIRGRRGEKLCIINRIDEA